MMRVIVAGAVAWTNVEAIRRELAKLPVGATVIHGDSPGANAYLAQQYAGELLMRLRPPCSRLPPDLLRSVLLAARNAAGRSQRAAPRGSLAPAEA
ncbi:hypothetical protein WMF27_09330 [Sorangium sp. So ce281]|uniref:hypothetical protein n=1 Tax=Sorangium sp. So ce281 TaxID=3133293 RepID=UPI003F630CF3